MRHSLRWHAQEDEGQIAASGVPLVLRQDVYVLARVLFFCDVLHRSPLTIAERLEANNRQFLHHPVLVVLQRLRSGHLAEHHLPSRKAGRGGRRCSHQGTSAMKMSNMGSETARSTQKSS